MDPFFGLLGMEFSVQLAEAAYDADGFPLLPVTLKLSPSA
jgi:hypothetical protein